MSEDIESEDIDSEEELKELLNVRYINDDENEINECWQCNASNFPLKATERVKLFERLKGGLTPYELIYGKLDSDTPSAQTDWNN